MGIDSLNIQNKALVQAAMLKKQDGSTTNIKNPTTLAMSKNGSIFNLINSKEAKKANEKGDLTNLNTLRSLNELNNNKNTSAKRKDDSPSKEMKKPGSASEGKAQAKQMEAQAKDVKSQTKETQQDAKTVNKFAADSQKLDKQIAQSDKKFASTLQKQQAELKRDNQKLDKLVKEQEETQKEIDNAQHELDSLMASSSFSISKGSNGAGQASDPNQARIAELQEYIGAKVSGMQSNGKAIYSLQRSQSRTLTKMNRTNAKFVKTQQTNTKALEQKESTTDKIVKVATKIEQVSALVTQGGQALKMLGGLMIAAGTMPWTAWMVPVGTVMEKVGTVAEMVGNYGQAAANVTKTAAYAADGNIAGALQSAAAAAQTGAAAVKSTKGLKDEFGKIDAKAKDANITREANAEAKKQVEDARTKAANDLAKEKGIDTTNMSQKDIEKAVGGKDAVNKQAFGTDANGKTISTKQARNAVSADLKNRSAEGGDLNVATRHNQYKQGKEVKAKISGQGATSFENARKTGFTNTVAKNAAKSSSSWGDKLEKFSKGLTMAGAMFGQQNATNPIDNNYAATTPKKSNVERNRERHSGTNRSSRSSRRRIA